MEFLFWGEMGDRALRWSVGATFLKGRTWAPRLRAKALVKMIAF